MAVRKFPLSGLSGCNTVEQRQHRALAPPHSVLEDRELTYHALAMGFGGEVMGEDAEVDIGVAPKASRR